MHNRLSSHRRTTKRKYFTALSSLIFPSAGILCGTLLSISLPHSISVADPNEKPYVPTAHSHSITHNSTRAQHVPTHHSQTSIINRATHPSSRPVVHTSHARSAQPTHSSFAHLSRSQRSSQNLRRNSTPVTSSDRAGLNSRHSGAGSPESQGKQGTGSGTGNGNGSEIGHFEFRRFNPCQLTPSDFTSSSLPAMIPGGHSLFHPLDSHGIANYRSAGKDLVADYCSYSNQNIFNNRNFNVSKESYQKTGEPLSLSDAKAVIVENVKANFDGTAIFDNTIINGHSALIIAGYDPAGGLVNYGIYVNGVLFEYYSNIGLLSANYLNMSDFHALRNFVEKITKSESDVTTNK